MVWCSGWRLASAVSDAGGLGIIGSASMDATLLKEHVEKCLAATKKPFGVNLPLLYHGNDEKIKVLLDAKVKIVFTSAGSPKTYTNLLKKEGVVVVHVVGSSVFAKKSEDAGVDAVVAEGFEAGGHNAREETTTMCLIPAVKKAVKIPVIAAGGIATGRQMLAALALGADAVQIGTRFVATPESSAHEKFKRKITGLAEGETHLVMRKLVPARLVHNKFYNDITAAENRGADADELNALLGKGRAKKGMFEGDLDEGELEIGQVASLIPGIMPAGDVVREILAEYEAARLELAAGH
ncbi:MAG: nitronate monooxygenase [Spirochaetia bacterium]|nr:nitronate monooxygenase [Spirochaetia bacterium]